MDYPFPSADADGRQPTALIIADDAHIISTIAEAAGARLLAQVALDHGVARLGETIAPDLVLLRCTAPHPALPALLEALAIRARGGGACLVVAGLPTVDEAYDALADHRVDLLCDPQNHDIVAAVALALNAGRVRQRAAQTNGEEDVARLRHLSEEVARLSMQLDELASRVGPASAAHLADRSQGYRAEQGADGPAGDGPAGSMPFRNLLRARRRREDYFPGDLFAEPSWDMMLDLMAARLAEQQVSVSSLCAAAAVPPTTALRWIRTLTERGIFVRSADPADGRRIFIALSDETANGLIRWHQSVRSLIQGAA